MSQENWGPKWTAVVGAQVRMLRESAGLGSVQKLADRCAELGFPIPRSTIANMENGQRPNVTVQEVAVLAAALGVPPVRLLYPIAQGDEPVEVLPGVERLPVAALEWFAGREDLETGGPLTTGDGRSLDISLARMERHAHHRAAFYTARIPGARDALADAKAGLVESGTLTQEELEDTRANALRQYERGAELALGELRQTRYTMRERDMVPPPLRETIREAYEAAGGDYA